MKKKIVCLFLCCVTLFVFGGCSYDKKLEKIQKIALETESRYIFVGAYGLTSENVYEPYSKFVGELVSDEEKHVPYKLDFKDEKVYYVYQYNGHSDNENGEIKYTFDVGLFSTEYRTKKTVLHKDLKGVKPHSSDNYRPQIFGGVADNHALLNYDGKLEIFDLDTNETIFSEEVEDCDSFIKEDKLNRFIGRHYLVYEEDTAVLYEYKGDYFLKHVFSADGLKGVNGWWKSSKIVIGDMLLLYDYNIFKYGVNFQTGEEISQELGTDLIQARYERKDDETYRFTVGGEKYTYEESSSDRSIKITRESDQETRTVNYGFLCKNSAAFRRIEKLWARNSNPKMYKVYAVEGKILIAHWAKGSMLSRYTPTYFFEYDFDGDLPRYAGLYDDGYNVSDTSKVYRIIRIEK
jgi:hypothetical protein